MKFFISLFSALCFLASPLVANPIEIIHQYHLETPSGRTAFLTDKLLPYTKATDELNHEIQVLAVEIKRLSPQDDQKQILDLTEKMTQKMSTLIAMMQVLDMAQSIEKDFNQIDTILHQKDPLSDEQQLAMDRISSLCSSIEK